MLTLFLKLFAFHPAILPVYFFAVVAAPILPESILPSSDVASLSAVDRTNNAAWLQHSWFQPGTTDAQIGDLCAQLRRSRIRFVYPHLTPSDNTGRLPAFSAESARRFAEVLRDQCSDVKILPWVGGVKMGYRQMRAGTVELDSDVYLQSFIQECIYLTRELRFDGVHVNIEPVESGNRRFLRWLKDIKAAIGADKLLSVAANKPSFLEGFNVSPLRSWDLEYLALVAEQSDQVVIMGYDTGLTHPFLYSLFVHEKMSSLLKHFAENRIACRVLLGVPTYDDAPSHSRFSENISSAVAGLKPVLTKSGMRENFQGLALYGYWTTDPSEWRELEQQWLQAK